MSDYKRKRNVKHVRLENTEISVEKGQSETTENDEEREMDFECVSVIDDIEGGMNDEGYTKSTMMTNFMCRQTALVLIELGP